MSTKKANNEPQLPATNNYPSAEQISAWKLQYGRVYKFDFPARSKKVKNPDYDPLSKEPQTIPNPEYSQDNMEPETIPNPKYQPEMLEELIAGPKRCYLRKPDRQIISYAQMAFKKRGLETDYDETLLNSCWLAGDPEIKTDGDYLLAIGPRMIEIIDIANCELEEL